MLLSWLCLVSSSALEKKRILWFFFLIPYHIRIHCVILIANQADGIETEIVFHVFVFQKLKRDLAFFLVCVRVEVLTPYILL